LNALSCCSRPCRSPLSPYSSTSSSTLVIHRTARSEGHFPGVLFPSGSF
jgi:hypothetical protein